MNKDIENLTTFNNEVAQIQKKSKVYNSANIINLTVGKIESDGDWGHGGRTYIKLDCDCTAAMVLITDTSGNKHIFGVSEWNSIEILAGGETERETLSEAMADIGKYLKTGIKEL